MSVPCQHVWEDDGPIQWCAQCGSGRANPKGPDYREDEKRCPLTKEVCREDQCEWWSVGTKQCVVHEKSVQLG